MAFQFLCPQGHLLQGDEAHMGMQCQCPQCGTAFIIPTIERPAGNPLRPADELSLAPIDEPAAFSSAGPAPEVPAMPDFNDPGVANLEPDALGIGAAPTDGVFEDEILHIPCPNGHELETPLDMLGERAICPHCGVEFRLKREKSVEYLRDQEIREAQRAQFWIRMSIVAAVVVVVALVLMVVVTSMS